jgi:hypothetical protein
VTWKTNHHDEQSKADKLAKQRALEKEYKKTMAKAQASLEQLYKEHDEKV